MKLSSAASAIYGLAQSVCGSFQKAHSHGRSIFKIFLATTLLGWGSLAHANSMRMYLEAYDENGNDVLAQIYSGTHLKSGLPLTRVEIFFLIGLPPQVRCFLVSQITIFIRLVIWPATAFPQLG